MSKERIGHVPGLPPYHFANKAAGWIFMNGNIPNPTTLVQQFAEVLRNPCHFDPAVDAERRVTLVTAAFDKGHELHDRHLIGDFEAIGIDAGWEGGYPTRVRNLSVWHSFKAWKEAEPWLYRRYTEKQDAILAIKEDYHAKMARYVDRAVDLLGGLVSDYPELGLFELYHVDDWTPDTSTERSPTAPDNEVVARALDRLRGRGEDVARARELRHHIDHLVFKDSEVLAACKAIEDHFRRASGIDRSELYLAQRERLWKTLLESGTIFIYGGRVHVLMNRLRFYDLHEAIREAVKRGTNVFGISAGSIIQSDTFSIALADAPSGGHQVAADEGVGTVRGVRIFPHAHDYHPYMRTGDRNELSFVALRHPNSVAVGLNQASVLLKESYLCAEDGEVYQRYSSVGDDPVLVFGPRGCRHEMRKGDQLLLPGTRAFAGHVQLARREELEELEWVCLSGGPGRGGMGPGE